jgi:hypothetical protein
MKPDSVGLKMNDMRGNALSKGQVNITYPLASRLKIKEDIDSEKAQNIILWTMNGLTDSALRYGDDIDAYKAHYDDMVKEFEEYLQILRKILYR